MSVVTSTEEKLRKIEEALKENMKGEINDSYFRLKVYAIMRNH